jgi:hypothetical protein
MAASSASGATIWTGTTGSWFDASNWSAGVPGAAGAEISNGGTAQIAAGQSAGASDVVLGKSGASGSISTTGGALSALTLTVQNGDYSQTAGSQQGTLNVKALSGATASYHLSGGTITGPGGAGGTATINSSGGTSIFTQDGGTNGYQSLNLRSNGFGSASYILNTGVVSSTVVSVGADASGSTDHFAQNGGTMTTSFRLNLSVQKTGTYDLTAGTLQNASISVSAGKVTQSGGTISNSSISMSAGGSWTMSGGTVSSASGKLDVFGPNTAFFQSAGSFTIRDEQISVGGKLTVTGGTHNPDALIISGGSLLRSGGSSALSALFISGSDSLLDLTLDPTNPLSTMTTFNTGVDGILRIHLADETPLPDPSQQFVLISGANSVQGQFDNVASGGRLVTDGGSFLVSYGAGSPFGAANVVLSDFQVPEPVGGTLMVMPMAIAVLRRHRRTRSSG